MKNHSHGRIKYSAFIAMTSFVICALSSLQVQAMTAMDQRLLDLVEDREAMELRISQDKERLIGKQHLLFHYTRRLPETKNEESAKARSSADNQPDGIGILTVGSFAICDFDTIQQAVTAANNGERIEVTNETYSGDDALFNVHNKALTIWGGYTHCDGSAVLSGRTVLDGTGMGFADSIIELSDTTGGMSVELRDLVIYNGQNDAQGGGLEVSGKASATQQQRLNITLKNVQVFANISTNGGGIHATDADMYITDGSTIESNRALEFGGGVFCQDSNILIDRDSVVGKTGIFPGNSADDDGNDTGTGGGLFLDNCDLVLDASDGVTGAYVLDNTTTRNGAGISATNASTVTMNGDKAWVNANIAATRGAGGGGGIHAQDLSEIFIYNGKVKGNIANNGGGIDLAGASLIMKRVDTLPCNGKCNELSENHGNNISAALDVSTSFSDSSAILDGVWVENNTTDSGTIIRNDNELVIKNAMIIGNVLPNLSLKSIIKLTGGTSTVAYSTIANNQTSFNPAFIFGVEGSGTIVDIHSNIIAANHDFFDLNTGPFDLVPTDSNILQLFGSFPFTDPLFVNPGTDFHITADSPAIDYGNETLDIERDIDFEPRGLAETPDAGADEQKNRIGINGAICAYATIADAIASANPFDTIYLTKGNYVESPRVTKSLTFIQADSNCQAAVANAMNGDLVIDGENGFISSGGLINISRDKFVSFRNMTLQNATANFGGIIYADLNSDLTLDNVIVQDGYAQQFGGGLRLHGVARLINGTQVISNFATNLVRATAGNAQSGGGIAVSSTGSLSIESGSTISNNQAVAEGGGVFAEGPVTMGFNTFIFANTADSGGGIYLKNADFFMNSGNVGLGSFNDGLGNQATTNGGGIYSTGGEISMDFGSVISNQAIRGGGIYLDGTTAAPLVTSNGNAQISYNHADYGGGIYLAGTVSFQPTFVMHDGGMHYNVGALYGGAIYSRFGFSFVERSGFQENSAGFSSVIDSGNSTSLFQNDVFYGNSGITGASAELFYAFDNTNITLQDSTLVAEANANVFTSTSSSPQVTIANTIFSGFTDTVNGPANYTSSCILDSTGELGSNATPIFEDAPNHDYHLRQTSPAINQCATGTSDDFDANSRPVGSGPTPFDIGAFEFQSSVTAVVLRVTLQGNGNVTSSPSGITCPSDCVGTFLSPTMVTLSQTASPGFVFVNWSGDCSGSDACVVDMTADKNVTANFAPLVTHNLNVPVSGSGSIDSNPVGIACGDDCVENYSEGTTVSLSANADPGYVLNNWSGDCSGNSDCIVSMSADRSVQANFVLAPGVLFANSFE